jgi:hypothetical protein
MLCRYYIPYIGALIGMDTCQVILVLNKRSVVCERSKFLLDDTNVF